MPLQSSVLNAVKTRASGGYPSEEEVDLAIATLLGNSHQVLITNKTQLVWLARLLLSDAVVDIVHHVNIALEHSPILSGRFQQLLLRSLRLASKVQSLRLELPLGNRGATFCTAIVKSIASQQLSSLYSMTTLTHRNIHYLLRPHPSPGQTRPLKCVAFHKCRRCPESDRSIGPHLQKLKAQAQCISRLVPGSPVEKVVVCNSGVPAIPYLSTLKETTAAVTAVTVPLSQFEEDLVVGLVRNLHRVEVLTLLEPVGTSNTSYPWWHDDKSLSHIWYLGLHALPFLRRFTLQTNANLVSPAGDGISEESLVESWFDNNYHVGEVNLVYGYQRTASRLTRRFGFGQWRQVYSAHYHFGLSADCAVSRLLAYELD